LKWNANNINTLYRGFGVFSKLAEPTLLLIATGCLVGSAGLLKTSEQQ